MIKKYCEQADDKKIIQNPDFPHMGLLVFTDVE